MVKVYKLKVGNVNVKYAHQSHKVLGKYTALGIKVGKGKQSKIITSRLNKKMIQCMVANGVFDKYTR